MNIKVKIQDTTYTIEVGDLHQRPIQAIIDGEVFEVWPEESPSPQSSPNIAQPISQRTPAPAASPKSTAVAKSSAVVRAPIPGVISAIVVHPGDDVKVGDELCKLEAMKMVNSIRSNRTGKVLTVHISVGQQVKHNDPLIEFEG